MSLTLAEAIRLKRLDEFAKQEERRGVQPVDQAGLNEALSKAVKPPRSAHQTSRSPSRGGSGGK